MNLHIYNTLEGQKVPFEPLDKAHVRMYVCGPTVYDRAHIGNARPIIVFDVLYRLLRRLYPRVTYVRNITDVDDKIIKAAEECGEEIGTLTERMINCFHEDIRGLDVLPPDEEPRATEHIEEMKKLIEKLLATNHAYRADGHVLFHVPSYPDYGKLSHRDREEMIAGARVEVASYKKDPADFVLWKPSTPDLPGWESPWGRGRPGWHLECSAMSRHYLGETFDIHGGGADLVFPHHENEIAQSECAHGGKPFAKYWVHNGFLTVEGEKMSKSLGNFITIREALDQLPGEAIKYNMLGTHYRKPADWTHAGELGAKRKMDQLYRALLKAPGEADGSADVPEIVLKPLLNDLNTRLALGGVEGLATELEHEEDSGKRLELK
ncbi:MAG: cysteine--tRNA ligase, partial [Alphaproteobacteria bacterium]